MDDGHILPQWLWPSHPSSTLSDEIGVSLFPVGGNTAESQFLTLAPGASGTVTFTGVTPGQYTVEAFGCTSFKSARRIPSPSADAGRRGAAGYRPPPKATHRSSDGTVLLEHYGHVTSPDVNDYEYQAARAYWQRRQVRKSKGFPNPVRGLRGVSVRGASGRRREDDFWRVLMRAVRSNVRP